MLNFDFSFFWSVLELCGEFLGKLAGFACQPCVNLHGFFRELGIVGQNSFATLSVPYKNLFNGLANTFTIEVSTSTIWGSITRALASEVGMLLFPAQPTPVVFHLLSVVVMLMLLLSIVSYVIRLFK